MKRQITLRGIPPEVSKVAEREARYRRVSLNKAFISLLEKAVGAPGAPDKPAPVHHDLDRFCGLWSAEEAAAFDGALADQRVVDEELWK